LKAIWLQVLQLEDVDEDDSFFARGGNSLKATLLIARIKDEFGVDLSVQEFFRKPTTRAVAQLISLGSKGVGAGEKVPDVKAVSRERYRMQLSDGQS
jgi:acyl carrier protein